MPSIPRLLLFASFVMPACAVDADPADHGEAATTATAQAQPEHRHEHVRYHCVLPWGTDWNRVLDLPDAALVIPACPEIHPGDRYVPLLIWTTNTRDGVEGLPVVYPDGYVPTKAAPMHDFLHKLERVRYVVQPGGQEYVFRPSRVDDLVTVGDLWADSGFFPPEQFPLPAMAFLGKLPPLPLGTYSTEIHLIMSEPHCDGAGTDLANNCLVAGDNFLFPQNFSVVP